jgi:hypothetical protein
MRWRQKRGYGRGYKRYIQKRGVISKYLAESVRQCRFRASLCHPWLLRFLGELKRDMSELRRDLFKLRDDQLQTRALVNEIQRKLS